MKLTPEQCKALELATEDLVRQGYGLREAAEKVCRAAERVLARGGGLGQAEILTQAAQFEPIKAARELVSPWLWITSLVGFGMAILNTRRISRMFKSWKGKQRK